MTLKLADFEVNRRGELIRADLVATPPKLHLYTNNVTPTESTVLADLTEATFPGYAAVALDFSAAGGVAAHIYTATPAAVVFTRAAGAGGDSVYGYYVTDSTNTHLLWSEKDAGGPRDLSVVGATYTVTAAYQGKDQ